MKRPCLSPMLSLLPVLFAATAGGASAAAPEWPMFRGPNASGARSDATPPVVIGPEASVAWKAEVPWSPSSPVVAGDRVFLTTFADGKLETRCYAGKDGALVWSRVSSHTELEGFHGTEGSPAAGSPATDGKTVVSYFGSTGLVAYDTEGKELWKHPLPVATTSGNFGSGTSPLIHDGRVILNRDMARSSSLMALDLKTGAKLWETLKPEAYTSYSTPVIWSDGGSAEIVVAGSLAMKAYDPVSGSERWSLRGLPSFTCTTPVFGDGLIYFAGWAPGKADSPWPTWESTVEKQDKNGDGWISVEEFDGGPVWFKAQDIDSNGRLERADWDAIGGLMKRGENVLLGIKPGGTGDVTATHVAWRQTRGLPYVPCPLYYDGRVYLIRDGGMMSSFDAKTGEVKYLQERLGIMGSYYASPVAADGRIYVASLDGTVAVVRAGGEKPEILHKVDFREPIAGSPALVGRRLYLRTQTKLYAFQKD